MRNIQSIKSMSIDVVVMTKWSNELSFASSYARRTRKLGEEISEEIPDVDPSSPSLQSLIHQKIPYSIADACISESSWFL